MENCLFCKIARHEIPSTIVYEDEDIIAFNDINPVAPIHILIIPKKHMVSTNDITPDDVDLIGRMFTVIKTLAAEKGISETGYRVITNCGPDSGQEVAHLHFHLIGGRTLGRLVSSQP
ncbi:histidine triad nucleotide-binding protein [Dehalobacter sp. DCM]|uniref:histidine triad nucleotide-binding protein n=1 Tax=Dehalobacter sp. DCM TaxID=2907827 RepID=UPI003081ED27|nr:histidine triad nucleotide-binding protein [Dehalobacter sp. DCM]